MRNSFSFRIPLFILFLLAIVSSYSQNPCSGYLTQSQSKLFNEEGEEVRLTGVNWFGFETSVKAPHGLWSRDYKSMLDQIKSLGFNCIRMPWSNEIMANGGNVMPSSINFSGPDPVNGSNPMNAELNGKTSLEVMDAIVSYAGDIGLKIILDNHSRAADAYLQEDLWYTPNFSEQAWIDDWVSLATRYAGNSTIIGMDLNNEPHGRASWGNNNPTTDWNKAAERCAEAILAVNPGVLIIVEGIGNHSDGSSYWWGGNLRGVRTDPVNLSANNKLVYSPHEYGPEVYNQTWFSAANFPNNMPAIMDTAWGFVRNEQRGHLLVGEFGIKDSSAFGGKSMQWFRAFLAHVGSDVSWTFWCMNPNSGDTGGILSDDWASVNQWKVDLLAPHMATLINCEGNTTSRNEILAQKIKIFPNPSQEWLFIESDLPPEEWQIFSSLGQLILSGMSKRLNLQTLTPGIYFLKIHGVTRKIVKV
ncbi:MAG: cellulase family glycosylhydrolase [Bacteroidota bacterium]